VAQGGLDAADKIVRVNAPSAINKFLSVLIDVHLEVGWLIPFPTSAFCDTLPLDQGGDTMVLVQDILRDRTLFSVESNQSVAGVARRMAELHVGAILVLAGDELRGLFSERDLMTRVVVEGRNPETTPVDEVMTTDLVTIEEALTLEEALDCMNRNNCRHLPVMRNGAVSGFLSMRDLMLFELDRRTEELHHLKAYVHGSA
jgi:CBS domain-containing protein